MNWFIALGVIGVLMIMVPLGASVFGQSQENPITSKPVSGEKLQEGVWKFETETATLIEDYRTGVGRFVSHAPYYVDYIDENGKPVYIKEKLWEDADKIYYESASRSIVFDKATCTYEEYDGGKLTGGTPNKKLSHTIKEALNGTDVWNPIMMGESCNVTYSKTNNGIQIIEERSNYVQNNSTGNTGGKYQTIYDVMYDGFTEWTYKYKNLDDTKTNHKYGFTFTCDGSDCNNVIVNEQPITTGESKGKADIIGKPIKVGNSNFDPKNEQHDYTWQLSKPQVNKLVVDFTHSKGKLPVGDTLTVDPTFNPTQNDGYRIYSNTSTGATCNTTASVKDATTRAIYRATSSASDRCYHTYHEFDISSLDNNSQVSSIIFQADVSSFAGGSPPTSCEIVKLDDANYDLSATAMQDLYDDTRLNSAYITGDTFCAVEVAGRQTGDLGTTSHNDLETHLSTDDLFSFGVRMTNWDNRDGTLLETQFTNEQLIVEYEIAIQLTNKPTSITTTPEPYMLNGTWSSCTGDNGCSGVEGFTLWNTTDVHYADIPLPINAGSDTEYGSVSNSVTMANTVIHFNFDGFQNQTSGVYDTTAIQNITDVSGNYDNATNVELNDIDLEDGLILSSINGTYFPLNFTTTSNLIEGTNDFHLGAFVKPTAWPFTLLSFFDSGDEITKIELNATKITVITDNSTDVASVDNSMNLNSWSFVGVDRNSNTFTFTLNGTTIGTNSSVTTDLAIANNDEFFIGGNGTQDTSGTGTYITYDKLANTAGWNANVFASEIQDTLVEGTQITHILSHCSANCGATRVALYDDSGGNPTNLLVESSSETHTTGWHTFDIADYTVTASDVTNGIWVAWQVSSSSSDMGYDNSGQPSGSRKHVAQAYGAFPDPFGSATNGSSPPSFIMNYTGLSVYTKSSGSLDEFFIKSATDNQDSAISERGFNDPVWLENITVNQTYAEFDIPGGINVERFGRVTLSNVLGNSTTYSDLIYGTTDNLPDAPSITASPVSETQIDVVRTAGASDGGDTITHYDLRYELNGAGGWVNHIVNGTIVNFYNHTGLSSGDDLVYQWRDRNGVGYSPWSSNASATTYEDTAGSGTVVFGNIGDELNATATITITAGSPAPLTLDRIFIYENNTLVDTTTVSESFTPPETKTIDSAWHTISDDDPHEYAVAVRVSNTTDTITIMTTGNTTLTREYNPTYGPAIDTTEGQVNYTVTRFNALDGVQIKFNRITSSETWHGECLVQTTAQARLGNSTGTTLEVNNTGYFNKTITGVANTHVYGTCTNAGELFSFVSYTNSSLALLGLSGFDDIYGGFIGVPVGIFFLVLVAAYASPRTAPIWLVVVLGMAGVMAATEIITLSNETWALALVAGILGLFVGRKFF